MKNRGRLNSLLKLAREQPQAFVHPRVEDPAAAEAWSNEWDKAWDKANEDANVGSYGKRKTACNALWEELEVIPVDRSLGYEPLRDVILCLCAYDDLGWTLDIPAQDVLNLYEMGAKQDTRLLLVLQTLRSLAQMETNGPMAHNKENDDERQDRAHDRQPAPAHGEGQEREAARDAQAGAAQGQAGDGPAGKPQLRPEVRIQANADRHHAQALRYAGHGNAYPGVPG